VLGVDAMARTSGEREERSKMMTRLVDAMQAMGLEGEAGSSGRWIRFPSGRGSACVVEVAWGMGYYAFHDDLSTGTVRDEPPADAAEIFLDPVSAIESCLPRAVSVRDDTWRDQRAEAAASDTARVRGDRRGAVDDAPMGQSVPVRHCDACGAAAVPVGAEAKELPARWGDVWFCDDCLRALPAAEMEGRTREIALRGVPLS
jgi:hypothetical protein